MKTLALLAVLLLAEMVAEREFGFRAPPWLNVTLVMVCLAVAMAEAASVLGGGR